MTNSSRPRLSFWQIWNMSFGFLGIQFGWGLQMANMSPIYKTLGAEESTLPYLWLAGPLTGLLVQPLIGAMSDRTWTRLGRRRPFFLIGAILSSIALIAMPHSGSVWMAAGLLWILDAAINTTMEPFRAFVGDKLPEEQRTSGFVMQSFFIGVGQTAANAFPWLLGTYAGVKGATAAGIPLTTYYSFLVGAAVFLVAVLWTVFKTTEEPPADIEAFRKENAEKGGLLAGFAEIPAAIAAMPKTMKQLAVVQFFTWFAFPCMWQFFGISVAKHVYGAQSGTPEFEAGTNWAGLCFAAYNVVCFAVAFLIPVVAKSIGRKATHSACLALGGLGLLGVFLCKTPHSLWLPMIGVGIAWSSILSLPYAMLAGAIPGNRMGVYMGVFNLFIVIPQVAMSFIIPRIYKTALGDDPRNVVMLGGAMLLVAAASVFIVEDKGGEAAISGGGGGH
jgi:maltose/moltooligosaccharide transporter